MSRSRGLRRKGWVFIPGYWIKPGGSGSGSVVSIASSGAAVVSTVSVGGGASSVNVATAGGSGGSAQVAK